MSPISKYLQDNEEIIWSSRPVKIAFFLPSLGGIPFALFFWGFVLLFLYIGDPIPSSNLFFLFFVIVPAIIAFGIPAIQLLRYNNSIYALTNQRVIIQSGTSGASVRFIDLSRINHTYVKFGLFDRWIGTGSVGILTEGQIMMSQAGGDFIDTRGGFPRIIPNLSAIREPYKIMKLINDLRLERLKEQKETA
jgi:membrane protein YdbS with pleckstrin-like domain